MFKQPLVLFVICFIFLITHSLRIILAFHRLIYREQFATALENRCNPHQFWTLTAASVSRFLLIFNSSVNFAIYCFISRDFRVSLILKSRKVSALPLRYKYVTGFSSFLLCCKRAYIAIFFASGNIPTELWKIQIRSSGRFLHGQKTRKHVYNHPKPLNIFNDLDVFSKGKIKSVYFILLA